MIERRFTLTLYKATERERERKREKEEGKEAERDCAIGTVSSSFRYIKIYFYTAPAYLSYIAGSFYRKLSHSWLSLVPLSIFVQLFTYLATSIWRPNVVVFAVIRIILATCKSERKTSPLFPFLNETRTAIQLRFLAGFQVPTVALRC